MVDPKLGLVVVLGGNIVGVELVLRIQLMQHGGVGALWGQRGSCQVALFSLPYSPPGPTAFPVLCLCTPLLYSSCLYLYPTEELSGPPFLHNLDSTFQFRKSIFHN